MIRWVTAVRVCGSGVPGTLSRWLRSGGSPRGGDGGVAGLAGLRRRVAAGHERRGIGGEPGFSAMIPDVTLPLPVSLASLLAVFGPLFTAPSFRTFCGLACGFLSQTGRRTVCGMPAGAPVVVAIDDTLFRRLKIKVWAASWFHDGSAPGPAKTGYGNNWVIAAIVVRLPMISRPVAVPVLAKLVIKNTSSASRLWLARRMTQMLAGALPGRDFHITGDAAYAGGELKKLPPGVTWTTRLRKDAALYALPPGRTGKRGRPRARGDKLASLARLAATAAFAPVTVTRYGTTATGQAAAITCLWYSVFGARPVTVVLIRDRSASGYDLALVTTDTAAPPARVIERYAARWSIEVGHRWYRSSCAAFSR